MTRFAIWNDANCLAARTPKSFYVKSDSYNYGFTRLAGIIHYAQEIYRGPPPNTGFFNDPGQTPRIRLEETKLPDGAPLGITSNPAISLETNFGGTQHEMPGATLSLDDVYAATAGEGITKPTNLVVQDGRHRPAHRMRASIRAFGLDWQFFPSTNLATYVDSVGEFFAIKTSYSASAVMFVPKIAGVVSLDGVYVTARPIINKPFFSRHGEAATDYAAPQIPGISYSLLEIGTFSGAAFAPQKRLVIPAVAFVDCALSRNKLRDISGTTFCCTITTGGLTSDALAFGGYSQAIEFSYTPPTQDHCLCGAMYPDGLQALPAWQYVYLLSASRGFNSGECPAFEKAPLDHGRLIRVPFWAGAPRSRHYSTGEEGPSTSSGYKNIAPQWSSWEQSQFPYTLHKTGALTIDGSVVPLEGLSGQRELNTPIYDLIDYTNGPWQTVEHYPARTVSAKAARVQATACGSHFEDSSLTVGKPRDDGKMVFNGKTIAGVNLTFIPYSRNNPTDKVATGISADTPAPPSPSGENGFEETGFYFPESRDYYRFGAWWNLTGTLTRPENHSLFPLPKKIYQGEYCDILNPGADQKTTESFEPFVEISPEKEIDAYVYAACLSESVRNTMHTQPNGVLPYRAPNYSISGTIDQWRFGRSNGPAWTGLQPAPLTGSYSLSAFNVSGIQSAGNLFRYTGEGQWNCDKTISYKLYTRVTSINDTYQFLYFWANNPSLAVYQVSPNRTARWGIVNVTERWKMRADVVELYCDLNATLQQAGAYQEDPDVAWQDEESQRNWVKQTFMKHDQPRGRLAHTVVYVDGQEPSPVLSIAIRYRTAMRAELTCSVDTSDLPNYPHSMSESGSAIIENSVRGIGGVGNVSGDFQTTEAHHGYGAVSFTFNKEQTAQLMNGEEVLAMWWQNEKNQIISGGFFQSDQPKLPAFADTGGIFLHAFKVRLDVEEA